tara:strand:- start:1932 stop:2156 length:225 start_codon:yes stop_codon:yes gene_type:complete
MTFEKNKINNAANRTSVQTKETFSDIKPSEETINILNISKNICLDGKLKFKNSNNSNTYAELFYDGTKIVLNNK